MRLIGFSGKSKAGKTTAAQHAIACFSGTKIALADAVKEEVAEFLTDCGVDFSHQNLWGSQADREEKAVMYRQDFDAIPYEIRRVLWLHMLFAGNLASISYRQLLQLWGTEYRRNQDPKYWVNKTKEKIQATEGLVFIDDIRFIDEAEMIHAEGGVLIRLEPIYRGYKQIANHNHTSETALDDYTMFDWRLFNGGTLIEFKYEVERLLRFYL